MGLLAWEVRAPYCNISNNVVGINFTITWLCFSRLVSIRRSWPCLTWSALRVVPPTASRPRTIRTVTGKSITNGASLSESCLIDGDKGCIHGEKCLNNIQPYWFLAIAFTLNVKEQTNLNQFCVKGVNSSKSIIHFVAKECKMNGLFWFAFAHSSCIIHFRFLSLQTCVARCDKCFRKHCCEQHGRTGPHRAAHTAPRALRATRSRREAR